MMANKPVLEKYNEHLSGPAKVVDATRKHMTVVKMSNRAAAPSGIIKAVEPLVPRTMRHSTTDQCTLAPPPKQINQRDLNKRLRMEQQIPSVDKFKQGDFNGQGVAAPADSVYEIAHEECEQWMDTWIGDCGRTVPKQVPAQMPDLPPEKQNKACPKHSPFDQAGLGVFRENHPTKAPSKFQRTLKRTMVTDEDVFTGKFRFHTRSTIGHLGKRAAEVMAPKNMGMTKTVIVCGMEMQDDDAEELATILGMTQNELDQAHEIFMITVAQTDMLAEAQTDMLVEAQEPFADPSDMPFIASIQANALALAEPEPIAVQESSPNKSTVMCNGQEVNPQQLPHKKTPAQKKLDKQVKEKATADKAQRTAIMLSNRQSNVLARRRTRKGLTPRTSLTPWWKGLSTVEESKVFHGYLDGVEGVP